MSDIHKAAYLKMEPCGLLGTIIFSDESEEVVVCIEQAVDVLKYAIKDNRIQYDELSELNIQLINSGLPLKPEIDGMLVIFKQLICVEEKTLDQSKTSDIYTDCSHLN